MNDVSRMRPLPAVLLAVLLAGCVTPTRPCVDPRTLPEHGVPRLAVYVFADGPAPTTGIVSAKSEAARRGAAEGLAGGAAGTVYFAAALGPLAPVGLVVGAVALPFVTAGSALAGAIGAPGKQKVAVVERVLAESWQGGLEETLAQEVRDYAARHRDVELDVRTGRAPDASEASGFARLEIAVDGGISRLKQVRVPFSWSIVATVTLRGAESPDAAWAGRYRYVSPFRNLSDWSKDDGRDLRSDMERARTGLVEAILDDVLAVQPLVAHCGTSEGELAHAIGLALIEPPTHFPSGSPMHASTPFGDTLDHWTTIDTANPLVKWAPLDRPGATDVTYELRIARRDAVLVNVYRREGLTEAEHRVEAPLPRGVYFWTVRARYVQDGRESLTEWSAVHPDSRTIGVVPNEYSFRFRVGSPRAAADAPAT